MLFHATVLKFPKLILKQFYFENEIFMDQSLITETILPEKLEYYICSISPNIKAGFEKDFKTLKIILRKQENSKETTLFFPPQLSSLKGYDYYLGSELCTTKIKRQKIPKKTLN